MHSIVPRRPWKAISLIDRSILPFAEQQGIAFNLTTVNVSGIILVP